MSIAPDTTLGPVALTVRDLDRAQAFYERVLGLQALEREGPTASLGAEAGSPLVELVHSPDAPTRPPGTTGLFHLAILVPTRTELAQSLRRLADAKWPLAGASDHLVSEALYLGDPEGNGIEIYRDRPSEEWEREGGDIRMATLPLDLRSLVQELDGAAQNGSAKGLQPRTRIGHVHLNVADLDDAEAFYGGLLGFDVTVRGYPGARFLSAGGYHHHIGLNTWAGEGAPAPPEGSAGLRTFEIALPSGGELGETIDRLLEGGADVDSRGDTATVRDPSGNRVVLAVRE